MYTYYLYKYYVQDDGVIVLKLQGEVIRSHIKMSETKDKCISILKYNEFLSLNLFSLIGAQRSPNHFHKRNLNHLHLSVNN